MKPLIIANWKMNPETLAEAKELFTLVKRGVKNVKNAEVVICPPFPYLSIINNKLSLVKLGAQDCFLEEKGAFTGEVSPVMLKDLGCKYVIVGHSERRRYFGETDEMVNKKLKAILKIKLKPILCIGETRKQREKGEVQSVLKSQLEGGLAEISKKEIQNTIIAYEPIWAIGTGKSCDTNTAMSMSLLIKKIIGQLYNRGALKNLKILYGGSVNSKNVKDFIKEAQIEGVLVGGASLDAKEFIQLVKNARV
ncbi:triose-phosphate isomerase [Patescibacteria group bacterium]|nr:triose-phosphate isomerase [Patescibacteria group bacterium]